MKLYELMKKIEGANYLNKVVGDPRRFALCIDVDGISVVKRASLWNEVYDSDFVNWNELEETLIRDYKHNVFQSLSSYEIDETRLLNENISFTNDGTRYLLGIVARF